jgi:ubiquinone/menaquinone biosynthesis C-methylase UbiE
MTLYYHGNTNLAFEFQYRTAQNFILPFVAENLPVEGGFHVMEVGCGEGGLLKAFSDKGYYATGIDLNKERFALAQDLMRKEVADGTIKFVNKNIHNLNFRKANKEKFDLIILKDTIEHIANKTKLMDSLKYFLKTQGKIFVGFPPWCMPFGGHQHICHSKILSHMPYFHLMPMLFYKGILNVFREPKLVIDDLIETKTLGISIERFERILRRTNYHIIDRRLYLISPNYKYKFNLKPKELFKCLRIIPHLRDFFTTAAYYLIEPMKIKMV